LYGQQRAETLVRDLTDAIAAAKTDKRVAALVLDLGHMAGGGVAKLEEVAAAIRDFRTSGKKVYAFGEGFDQAQYYIAAQPTRSIWIRKGSCSSTASATTARSSRG
jgi:protease-4